MADFPSDYTYAADWIWNNRITAEKSTERRNTIFDQIDAGNGTINYVVRWQSYRTLTLEQRQQFEKLVSDSINGWNDWLKGWDGWKYDHVDVKIVGWAVLDKSVLQDLQPDEVVYDNLISDYDSTYDTSNGVDTIPDKLPSARRKSPVLTTLQTAAMSTPTGWTAALICTCGAHRASRTSAAAAVTGDSGFRIQRTSTCWTAQAFTCWNMRSVTASA